VSREDVIMVQREQPFIHVDKKVLKECRKTGSGVSYMLLTYFVLQEMEAAGKWDGSVMAEHKLGELTGLDATFITLALNKLDKMGVFNA